MANPASIIEPFTLGLLWITDKQSGIWSSNASYEEWDSLREDLLFSIDWNRFLNRDWPSYDLPNTLREKIIEFNRVIESFPNNGDVKKFSVVAEIPEWNEVVLRAQKVLAFLSEERGKRSELVLGDYYYSNM